MSTPDQHTPVPISSAEDEIDLKELIIPVWKARKQILVVSFIFALLGAGIGFITPNTYTAGSTFLPQTAESGVGGNLGGLAALAGINLNAPVAGGELPPAMYARILGSEAFRKRILDAMIEVEGDSMSYRSYLLNQPQTFVGELKKYTIGLPGLLLVALKNKQDQSITPTSGGLRPLSDEEFQLHESLGGKISISNDKKEGIVSLEVVEGNPFVAAQVAKVTEAILQDWIITHKIKNAKAHYDFIDKQYLVKQEEFYKLQDQLSAFMDRNQNVSMAYYQNQLTRLQTEFTLLSTVYTELAKQREQAAIQLSKDTPTFSLIEPVQVPKLKTGPKRILFLLGGFFMGLIFSSIWALAKIPVKSFFQELKESTA